MGAGGERGKRAAPSGPAPGGPPPPGSAPFPPQRRTRGLARQHKLQHNGPVVSLGGLQGPRLHRQPRAQRVLAPALEVVQRPHQAALALVPLGALLKTALGGQAQQLGLGGGVWGTRDVRGAAGAIRVWEPSAHKQRPCRRPLRPSRPPAPTRLAVHAQHGARQRHHHLHARGGLGGGVLCQQAQV